MKAPIDEHSTLYPEWHDFRDLLTTYGKVGFMSHYDPPEYHFMQEFRATRPHERLNPKWFNKNGTANHNLEDIVHWIQKWWFTFSEGIEMQGLLIQGSNADGSWRDVSLAKKYGSVMRRLIDGKGVEQREIVELGFIPGYEELMQNGSKWRLEACVDKLSKPSDLDFMLVNLAVPLDQYLPHLSHAIDLVPFKAPTEMQLFFYGGGNYIGLNGRRVFDALGNRWYALFAAKQEDNVMIKK